MKKFLFWAFLAFALLLSISMANAQSVVTTRYYAQPFSVDTVSPKGMDFTLDIQNDALGEVDNALVSVQAVTFQPTAFTLLVNDQVCLTPVQKIDVPPKVMSTLKFDCSNIIVGEGVYTVHLVPTSDIATVSLWSELEYTELEKPIAEVQSVDTIQHINNTASLVLSGTDYEIGDNAKAFLQLNLNNEPVNNASCYVKIWYPNSTIFQDYIKMDFLDEGIYYHDFSAPSTVGVYPVASKCNYLTIDTTYVPTDSNKILGGGTTNLGNIGLVDGSYSQQNENGADAHFIEQDYNFTGVNSSNFVSLQLYFDAVRIQGALDPATDNIHLWILNFSSNTFVELAIVYNYSATVEAHYPAVFQPSNFSQFIRNNSLTIRVNDTLGNLNDIVTTLLDIDRLIIVISANEGNTSVNTLRGSGELNIRSHFTNILNNQNSMSLVLNDTNTIVKQINNTVNNLSFSLNFTPIINILSGINNSINAMNTTLNVHTVILNQINATVNSNFVNFSNITLALQQINSTLNNLNFSVNFTNITVALAQINATVNSNFVNFSNITLALVQINSTVNNLNFSVNFSNLTNALSQMNTTLNGIGGNVSAIRTTLQTIIVSISNLQSSVDTIGFNVNDLQSSLTQVKNNLTFLISLEQNETQADLNLTNITSQLNAIQTSINLNTMSLSQVNTTANTILFNLNGHISEENTSEALELSYLQNISINISSLALTLNSISLNISSQNVSSLNDSLTGLIISEHNAPVEFDLTTLLIVIFVILLIASTIIRKGWMSLVTGLYSTFFGFYLWYNVSVGPGIIITAVGIIYCIVGLLIRE